MSTDDVQRLLAEFGKIPEHQVKMIWNLAYDAGFHKGKSTGYSNAVEFLRKHPEELNPSSASEVKDG